MVIEDFGPKLVYIKGESNVVAEELSWFEKGTRDLHTIAKGLADLKKQINSQLNKKVPDLITLA